jgi:hypothetical protein
VKVSTDSAAIRSAIASARRDLPTPGSAEVRTTRPSPAFACAHRRNSSSISSSRSTNGVAPDRSASNWPSSASNWPSARFSDNTYQAGTADGRPLKFDGTVVLAFEEAADLPPGRHVDHHLTRRGEALEACCKVWGLAHYSLLTGITRVSSLTTRTGPLTVKVVAA